MAGPLRRSLYLSVATGGQTDAADIVNIDIVKEAIARARPGGFSSDEVFGSMARDPRAETGEFSFVTRGGYMNLEHDTPPEEAYRAALFATPVHSIHEVPVIGMNRAYAIYVVSEIATPTVNDRIQNRRSRIIKKRMLDLAEGLDCKDMETWCGFCEAASQATADAGGLNIALRTGRAWFRGEGAHEFVGVQLPSRQYVLEATVPDRDYHAPTDADIDVTLRMWVARDPDFTVFQAMLETREQGTVRVLGDHCVVDHGHEDPVLWLDGTAYSFETIDIDQDFGSWVGRLVMYSPGPMYGLGDVVLGMFDGRAVKHTALLPIPDAVADRIQRRRRTP